MSRFNEKRNFRFLTPDTTNLAGGAAFSQSPKLELASLVTTSMLTDQYYRSADAQLTRLRELVGQVDPLYAAKAAVYARNEDGIRSVTHALAGELAHSVKGEPWAKRFYDRVVRRPDDATEILAYYLGNYGKPIPNSLKKGLGLALGKFDEYQLAKYRGEGRDLSLVDVVNLVHPQPSEKNAGALSKLVRGTLRSERTFESSLSQAGKAEDKAAAKADAWRERLEAGDIGYFALLKNLRNISEQAPELIGRACELLTNKKLIRDSLVLPFRYVTAIEQLYGRDARILAALSEALDKSLANVPDFGRAAIWVDGSGSMESAVAGGDLSRKRVGSLFAAALYKKNPSNIVGVFGDNAGPVTFLNPTDSTLSIERRITETCYGHSTNFHAIFDAMEDPVDTVIIFSDMQAWVPRVPTYGYYGYGTSDPKQAFADYRARTKSNPHVFSFDLAGYGSLQFPEPKVFALAGFSDKTIGLMENLKVDPQAFVKKIEAVEI